MIGCLEEIAYENGFIDYADLCRLADRPIKSAYGAYLRQLAKNAHSTP
jgi:dTDP-glucose pyrophosphorylase